MSTIKVNTIQNASGVEVYTNKAWVNFNGTGTIAIRADGNVSSLTDNGNGRYTINFSTSLADANHSTVGTSRDDSGYGMFLTFQTNATYTTSAVQIRTTRAWNDTANIDRDADVANLQVTR